MVMSPFNLFSVKGSVKTSKKIVSLISGTLLCVSHLQYCFSGPNEKQRLVTKLNVAYFAGP